MKYLPRYSAEQRRPSGGSIFSSPKLIAGSSNPFAVRSSPGRIQNADNNGEMNHVSTPSSIIAPSKFGAPSHETTDNNCNGSSSKPLLRPSLIGSPSSSILKPATLGSSNNCSRASANPFARAVDVPDDTAEPSTNKSSVLLLPSRLNHVADSTGSPTAPAAAAEGSSVDQPSTPIASTNLFAAATAAPSAPVIGSSNFVFGQKLHERVANPNHTTGDSSTTTNGTTSSTPSSSDNLFTVVPKEKTEAELATSNGLAPSKSLSDSARELEEQRAAKRKYDEVMVVTGEEDEQNALQINGKLFTFDKDTSNWVERGRGTLRLNDKQMDNQTLQSRLVMRTQGSLRVILNTKVWAEMTIDKTSDKSIRLTAVDGDHIRVFLLMASLKDTETLFNALEWRLATLRAQQARAAAAAAAAVAASAETNPDESVSPKRRSSEPEEDADEAKKKRSE